MKAVQLILLPLTLLYKGATQLRNYLYDRKIKKSFEFDTKVINVGNLTVGGTGKTPHVEYLIRHLSNQYNICTLSRGYGRKTKGFILADEQATAQSIGDEPMQFYCKFSNLIGVAVGEDRATAIPQILFERETTELIILDDAFQHRAVIPNINILLCDFNRPFYQDFPFPSGRLRESRYGAKRANLVIVSKCPADLATDAQLKIQQKIQPYIQPTTPIFFTTMRYGKATLAKNNLSAKYLPLGAKVVLVSGIAQAAPLETYVKQHYTLLTHIRFPDHHHYQANDLRKIRHTLQTFKQEEVVVLTTEKDEVKLSDAEFTSLWGAKPRYYLPIEVQFLAEEPLFREKILRLIS